MWNDWLWGFNGWNSWGIHLIDGHHLDMIDGGMEFTMVGIIMGGIIITMVGIMGIDWNSQLYPYIGVDLR